MSLLPYILSELRDLSSVLSEAPRRRWDDDDVDLIMYPLSRSHRPFLRLVDSPLHSHLMLRPKHKRQLTAPERSKLKKAASALAKRDDNAFIINVDVQQFLPEELSVQVLKDEGYVVVEGKHEERPDEHGYVQRQFTRRYKLPSNVDPDTVTSRLTPDGVLCVSAPRKDALPAPKEDNVRYVPIAQTDRPAVQDVPAKDDGKSNEHVNGEEKMET